MSTSTILTADAVQLSFHLPGICIFLVIFQQSIKRIKYPNKIQFRLAVHFPTNDSDIGWLQVAVFLPKRPRFSLLLPLYPPPNLPISSLICIPPASLSFLTPYTQEVARVPVLLVHLSAELFSVFEGNSFQPRSSSTNRPIFAIWLIKR